MRSTVRLTTAAMLAALAGSAHALAGAPFPGVIDLASLDGASGFTLNGAGAGERSGTCVAPAGDINGDGIADLLVGALGASPGGTHYAGSTYVVFGKDSGAQSPFPAPFDLSSLDGAGGFRLDGHGIFDYSGASVARAGDVNGDGVDDLIIGARNASPNGRWFAGSSYVVFGKNTGVAGDFPASIDLSALDPASGFRIDGASAYDLSGDAVAAAGDVNGDGVDDLLIGARNASPGARSMAGSTYVVFGKDTSAAGAFPATLDLSSLDGATGFRLDGAGIYDQSGRSVAAAGDLNGDGVDDLVVGAFGADPNALPFAGSTYVVFGKDMGVAGAFPAAIALSSLDGATGFRLDGVYSYDFSGWCVASAGDINGDGLDDLAIGARLASRDGRTRAGVTFVVFGKDTGAEGGFPSAFDLATLDGANGFLLEGAGVYDFSGWSVAGAGDVNGDGVDDLLIGARNASPEGRHYAGVTHVFFGKDASADGAFPASVDLATLDGENGFTLIGAQEGDRSGNSVAAAGDLNDDGVADLVIGAFTASPGEIERAGATYVVFGRGPAPCPGDINGDRVIDFFDLNFVLTDFNLVGPGLLGDVDHDGDCDFFDLNIILTFFNTAC